MSNSSGKVCLVCGFEGCETIETDLTDSMSTAGDQSILPVADQSEQIQQASRLLAVSKSTLICGLDSLDLDAQMAAWKLADQSRAIVDTSLTKHSHAAVQSLQRKGKVSATYGEIRRRSDLIVIWDCNLQRQHSCLLRMFTRDQMLNREIIFVGASDAPMAAMADRVFALNTTKDRNAMVRLICRLRAITAGKTIYDDQYGEHDLPAAEVQELFYKLASASYGSLFYSHGEQDWEFDFETESLLRLVSELNSIAPLVSVAVRNDGNGLGAENILTLTSGFPFGISLQRGHAESTGSLYTASEMLRRAACDLILLCGNAKLNGGAEIPNWMRAELTRVTVVQLAPQPDDFADVFLACPVVRPKHTFAGNVFRGDGVVLTGSKPDTNRSAEFVLQSLIAACQNTSISNT